MWHVGGFVQWASEQEKLLVQQGNLLAMDDQTGFFRALITDTKWPEHVLGLVKFFPLLMATIGRDNLLHNVCTRTKIKCYCIACACS